MSARVDVTNGVDGKAHLLGRLNREYRDLLDLAAGLDDIAYETAQPLVPFSFTVYNFLFNPEQAAGQDVTLQYDVEHPDGTPEPWTVAIQGGRLVVAPGAPESPEAVLRLTPSQLLLRVCRHQSCRVTGDED